MKEIIRLEKVSYRYNNEHIALNNISVSIHEGEKVAVLGNNGAGKSTFFLCCNGILKPDKGDLFLRNKKIGRIKKEILSLRQAVGLVFQDPDNQIIAGTVEEEISFGPMNLSLPEETIREQVDDAIMKMQLDDFRKRSPHYLSGGEKKRVTIADILSMNPQLILFDEPTANLDPENTCLFEKNLNMMSAKGLGLVIATHDIDFAWRWADRIIVFHKGQLLADADPELIFSNEQLIKKCGLVQPILFQVGKKFGINPLPRASADLN